MYRFRVWGRTAGSVAKAFVQPASEEEIVRLVQDARAKGERLKVVGAGHSWSDAACTDGVLLNLDKLSRVVSVDAERLQITVEAGIRLKHLNEELANHGLAMPVLGSIAEQSIAGAISTGTHGSAPKLGGLASAVVALRIVLGTGEVRDLSEKDGDLFHAAQVGIGALGIVTRVTLQCVRAFRLEEIAAPLPFAEAVRKLPELVATERFVKLWWLPHTGLVQVFRYRETNEASTFSSLARWIDDRIVNRILFAGILFFGRIASFIVPLLNRVVRLSYFRPSRRIARSDLALTLAMPPVHQEVEYALPLERAQDAMRFTEELIRRENLRVNFIFEVRFVAAEKALLSPAFGRPTVYVGAYMAQSAGIERYFALFEKQMLAWGGRPHWGKQFSATADELRAVHPNLQKFEAIRRACDPDGVFRNAFLDRVFAPSNVVALPPAAQG